MMQSLHLPEQATVVRRAVLAAGDVLAWIPGACSDVADHLYHRQAVAAGFAFARCHRLPGGLVGVEAGFPIGAPVRSTGLIFVSSLPAGAALSVRYTGPREGADAAIDDWLHAENAVRAGDSWEIYRDLPSCPGVGRHLEIVQPIAFAHISV